MNSPIELTYPQKAAAILVAMGKERASQLLKFFKNEELRKLIDAAHTLQTIPQPDLEDLVQEFESEFAVGSGLLDSADTMNSIVSEAFTPEEFSELLNPSVANIEPTASEEIPVWEAMAEIESNEIAEFIDNEHPQTIAVILSNLPPQKAADVIALIDRETRKLVLTRMLSLGPTVPAALEIVEGSLREHFLANSNQSGSEEGRARVASLLNELDKPSMEEVMDDLSDDADPDNIAAVKSLLFRFEDIVQLDKASRSAIFDTVSAEVVTTALRDIDDELKEAVLEALGQRTRRMIESELSSASNVKQDVVANARREIAALAIRLAGEGRVTLPAAQEAA